MNRSIHSQIIDTLHLMLRILLGLALMYSSILVLFACSLGILLGIAFSDKYGSPFYDPLTWSMIIAGISSVPSFVGGVIVTLKNRVAQRNPKETLLAMINVVLLIYFINIISQGEDTHTALIVLVTSLLATASSAAIIVLAKKSASATSVIS